MTMVHYFNFSILLTDSPRDTVISGKASIILNNQLDLRCNSTALPAATYTWFRNGAEVIPVCNFYTVVTKLGYHKPSCII